MKIGIVAPSAVPFSVGGAEKLWWGLQNHINKFARHQCELIKIPTKEHTFWDLIESYYKFYQLDLSYFDMVISGKYPAWMIKHENHHLYMLHCLRGLYDTYCLMNLPTNFPLDHPKIANVVSLVEKGGVSIDVFFEVLFDLKNDTSVPRDILTFPGPFIRKIIHFLDRKAMSGVKRFSAISQTVADRREYYPEGAQVKVIYPPSSLAHFKTDSHRYFFTVSRLDGPKRIRMILEAYLKAKTDIPLKIAGTGPLENELREMARDDKRIEFLGFITDEELIDYYANAYAVIFIPFQEDLGFITIEAMRSEKPVITFADSGGVTEFVEEGETGFLCQPDVMELKNVIESVSKDKEKIIDMGKKARRKVDFITWEYTIGRLLNETQKHVYVKNHPIKLTAVSTFPIYPPRGGGQSRIFHLYRHLAKKFDVELVTMTHFGEPHFRGEVAPNLWENRIPKTEEHQKEEWALERKLGGVPITDVAMPQLYHLTPAYLEALRDSAATADVMIASHPYLLPAILEITQKPIWYEAQDVEVELKKDILPRNDLGQELLERIRKVENECCHLSRLIMVCSKEDGEWLNKIYQADRAKIIEVPNGVDLDSVKYVPPQERMAVKKKLGLKDSFNILFMGSWHGPNLEAIRSIFHIARELQETNFLIVGSACLPFQNEKIPSNVGLMGIVDDETKNVILGMVDLAINPMESGSGTNLKMLDYCAAGIPIISTTHGIRGLKFNNEIEIVSLDQFPNAIIRAREKWNELGERIERAKSSAIAHYDWAIIAENFIKEISKRGMLLP